MYKRQTDETVLSAGIVVVLTVVVVVSAGVDVSSIVVVVSRSVVLDSSTVVVVSAGVVVLFVYVPKSMKIGREQAKLLQ